MKKGRRLKQIGIVLLVLLNIGCDQVSKDVVRKKVDFGEYIEIVPDHFILTNVENTGAMLGFGDDFSPWVKIIVLQLIPVLILFVLLFRVLLKKTLTLWDGTAFSFVIGGGIGNLIDRIAYGSVTDFFQIRLGFLKTGIFNMADVSVTLGVLLLLALSLSGKKIVV
ncbi:signal peptidase II [Maribacter sp. 2-571]|uniref:signal peptidase II n=1 Tax=Maribacter sp. 2-571 TaxID=3417569 RepID=UPI003D330727